MTLPVIHVGRGFRGGGTARDILAAVIGNMLEWFDVLVYGYFVSYIAVAFFPARDSATAKMLAFGAFAVAFIARPLGAIALGRYADVAGRKKALVLVTSLMFVGTTTIAFLPSYRQIGLAAPALLVVARLVQGFSAGGEFGSATAFLVERSPRNEAFHGSWQFASQGLGMLLASAFGAVLISALSPGAMQDWGWRVPFVFGMLIGPVAYIIRQHVMELAGDANVIEHKHRLPWKQDVIIAPCSTRSLFIRIVIGIGLVLAATVGIYLLVYMPSYAASIGMGSGWAYSSSSLAGLIILIISPVAGLASDRFGLHRVAVPAVTAMVVFPIPTFLWLAGSPGPLALHVVQALVAAAAASYFGALPALLSRLFPATQRGFGLAVSYNVAVMAGGGIAPIVFAVTIQFTGSNAGPAYYLVAASCVTLVALWPAARVIRCGAR